MPIRVDPLFAPAHDWDILRRMSMAMLRRWRPLLVPMTPFLAYGLWYLDPIKPHRLAQECHEAYLRRDFESFRKLFSDRLQKDWCGEWNAVTPEFLRAEFRWDRKSPAEADPDAFDEIVYLDPCDLSHRYVGFFAREGLPGTSYIRMKWTGMRWLIDGLWGHGCLVPEGELKWRKRLIRLWER